MSYLSPWQLACLILKKRSHALIGHFSAQHAERETEIHSEHGQIILTISVNTESAHVGHCWQATVTTMNKSVVYWPAEATSLIQISTLFFSYIMHACSELSLLYFSSLSCCMELTKIWYRIMHLQWITRRKHPSISYSLFIGSSSIHSHLVCGTLRRAKVDMFHTLMNCAHTNTSSPRHVSHSFTFEELLFSHVLWHQCYIAI